VRRGNFDVTSERLVPLRLWYPIEVLHFPVRSPEQCRRKFVAAWTGWTRNPTHTPTAHQAGAYEAIRSGRLHEYYESLSVDDARLDRGLEDGTLHLDARVRDALRALRASRSVGDGFCRPPAGGGHLTFGKPGTLDPSYIDDVATLAEYDSSVNMERRLDVLERRLEVLEQMSVPWAR